MKTLLCLLSLVFVPIAVTQNAPVQAYQDTAMQPPPLLTDVAVGAPYDWKHPEYPKKALKKKLEGSVVLRLSLDETGQVVNAVALSGDQEFAEAAIRGVRKWKYSPYLINNTAVRVTTLVSIDFRLNGSGKPEITASYKDWLPENVFKVGGSVSPPRAIYTPDPAYTLEARSEKYKGTCVLAVVVGVDGRSHEIRVLRPLGKGLDEQAIEAVKQWKFSPGKKDGQPVAVMIKVEVQFRLY